MKIKFVAERYKIEFENEVNRLLKEGWRITEPDYHKIITNVDKILFTMILVKD